MAELFTKRFHLTLAISEIVKPMTRDEIITAMVTSFCSEADDPKLSKLVRELCGVTIAINSATEK